MRSDTELRRRPDRVPELDAEQEVDVGRLWRTLAARWWLPLAGLVVGAFVGYALSFGAGDVYKAEAVIYLGQPFSPNGNAPVQSLATNPRTVGEIVRSEFALREAAGAAGLRPGALRNEVSTQSISGAARGRVAGQNPLVEVSVQTDTRRSAAVAAETLAERVVVDVSGYVREKIDALEEQISSDRRELQSIDSRLRIDREELDAVRRDRSLSLAERLIAVTNFNSAIGFGEQRRAVVQQDLLEARQLLSLARNVEQARVVERPVAVKTTARSTRVSVLVGAAIGLLLGTLVALFWEPLARRAPRPPSL